MRISEIKLGHWFKHKGIEYLKFENHSQDFSSGVNPIAGTTLFSNSTEVELLDRITIDKSDYTYLLNRDQELSCLEAGGVDNWEWYGESLENFKEIE